MQDILHAYVVAVVSKQSDSVLFLCSILQHDTDVVRAPVIPDSPVRVPEIPVSQISVQPSAPGKQSLFLGQDIKVMYLFDLHFGSRRNVVCKPQRPCFFCCLKQVNWVVRYNYSSMDRMLFHLQAAFSNMQPVYIWTAGQRRDMG